MNAIPEAAPFSPAMMSAQQQLRKLIDEGIEFPDACWKIAKKTGFMVHELRNAYDLLAELDK